MTISMRIQKTSTVRRKKLRAQSLLKKNRKNWPKWYWRLLDKRNTEQLTISYYFPRVEITMNDNLEVNYRVLSEPELKIHSVSLETHGAPGTSVRAMED